MPDAHVCAMTGETRCFLELAPKLVEALEQHDEILGELRVFNESLRHLVEQHRCLVEQDRVSKKEFIATLQNRVPQGYVPMRTHIVTILVALGITQIPVLAKMVEYYIR